MRPWRDGAGGCRCERACGVNSQQRRSHAVALCVGRCVLAGPKLGVTVCGICGSQPKAGSAGVEVVMDQRAPQAFEYALQAMWCLSGVQCRVRVCMSGGGQANRRGGGVE